MLTLNVTEAAYMAGIIDGEGNLGAYSSKARGSIAHRQLRVQVATTSEALRDFLLSRIGGWVGVRPVQVGTNLPLFSWAVTRPLGVELLTLTLPHMVVKREQAEIWLDIAATYDRTRCGRPVPPDVLARRERLANQLNERRRAA